MTGWQEVSEKDLEPPPPPPVPRSPFPSWLALALGLLLGAVAALALRREPRPPAVAWRAELREDARWTCMRHVEKQVPRECVLFDFCKCQAETSEARGESYSDFVDALPALTRAASDPTTPCMSKALVECPPGK